ncbi:MAG: hypothetical protein LBM74_04230 [Oscillospiraceae bacterium]|nr:hypothetical protein [Oscillospiraceae bacterium]
MKKGIAGALLCILLLTGAGAMALEMQHLYEGSGGYDGYIVNGQYNGFGMYYFSAGNGYTGMFKDGAYSGYGCYLTGEEGSYILIAGQFENNKLNGEGVVHYEDGTRIAGQFADGLPVPDQTTTTVGTYLIDVKMHDGSDAHFFETLVTAPGIAHGYGLMVQSSSPQGSSHDYLTNADYFIGTFQHGAYDSGILVQTYPDYYTVTTYTDGEPGGTTEVGKTIDPATIAQPRAPGQ